MKLKKKSYMKGQGAETAFVLTLLVFVSVAAFLTLSISQTFPGFTILSGFDLTALGTEFFVIAGTCVITSGIPCAAALVLSTVFNLFVIPQGLLFTLIVLPLSITLAYVIARLARGGG
jgi:hypothetical protein